MGVLVAAKGLASGVETAALAGSRVELRAGVGLATASDGGDATSALALVKVDGVGDRESGEGGKDDGLEADHCDGV